VVYREFDPEPNHPAQAADWQSELIDLQQSALDTIGTVTIAVGYLWLLLQLLAAHPRVALLSLPLPLSICATGTLALLVRRPLRLRSFLYVLGMTMAGVAATFASRAQAAPFVYVIAITCASLIPGVAAPFLAAMLSTALMVAGYRLVPGMWSAQIVIGAVAVYWGNATIAWLTSRNLHSVLGWALGGYEQSWRTTREVQLQQGKVNRILKDLADANLLLKRTTYDLAEARLEAEHAGQMKAQFAANISHELRTPLHLIVGFSQMMHMSPDNYRGVVWTPELRGDVQEIYESSTHLLHLIDDVLDLSQIDAARLPVAKERIALAPLIRDAVDTARSLLRESGLYLRLELPDDLPPVFADPTRIRQTLLNLLNNAARFTERGGISIAARTTDTDIEVTVSDTGIGIPAAELQEIFVEFHQVDGSVRRKYGGTGLGLALCKHFLDLHDGRIWADSELGRGSTFHFTLPLPDLGRVPLQRSQPPVGWRYPASRPGDAAHRLVILADHPELPRFLHRYLPEALVLEAHDRDEAIAVAIREKADAILVAGDECSVDEVLPEEEAGALLPVISLSWPIEQQLALAHGFTHCLMKPFTGAQLGKLLAEAAPGARRLLVVDDDPGVARLVERSLAGVDVQVAKAYDGPEALTAVEEVPDVVLLDLILPRLDGLAVLEHLRRQPGGGSVPVIAITAYGFRQEVADLGPGSIEVRRRRHFSANEVTRWLGTVLAAFPARYLEPGGPDPALAPVPPG
jgi:signal transduction histidine kinase/CheY-like chemotaxis protein